MKIRVMSDLHLEYAKLEISSPPNIDVVVLAGDISQGDRGLVWARGVWPDQPIIYVAGNHEFYSYDRHEALELMKLTATSLGIHFLENDEVVIGGVRFLGCTLWTDFCVQGAEDQFMSMEYARDNIGDYFYIKQKQKYFTPEDSLSLHIKSRSLLCARLSDYQMEQKTVVVTHHAPSIQSVARRFSRDPLTPCFASSLDSLVRGSDLWIHGHMHDSFDYVVGDTRVICNPRGYNFMGPENPFFILNKFVEI